ncbi:MAG: hypothetical protein KDJ88_00715, partial [Bauldia sp.]|nr:hypothetical protein [Bauldia sp.]
MPILIRLTTPRSDTEAPPPVWQRGWRRFCLAGLALVAATGLAHAVDRKATERDFQAFLANEIWPEAQAAGVSRKSFDAALGGVTLDWDLPELVPP